AAAAPLRARKSVCTTSMAEPRSGGLRALGAAAGGGAAGKRVVVRASWREASAKRWSIWVSVISGPGSVLAWRAAGAGGAGRARGAEPAAGAGRRAVSPAAGRRAAPGAPAAGERRPSAGVAAPAGTGAGRARQLESGPASGRSARRHLPPCPFAGDGQSLPG